MISTAILTAAMLVIVIGVLGFSANLFSIQTQQAEFGQAQNIIVNFADGIDDIASREGASTYVRFNIRAGGPVWNYNFDTILVNVSIYNQTDYSVLINGTLQALTYRGGSQIGTGSFAILRGVNDSAVFNNAHPLGRVSVAQANGAYITLDYARVGVSDLGFFNISKGLGGGHDYINIVQVNLINLTFGSSTGGASTFAVATNVDMAVKTYRLNFNSSVTPLPSYNLWFNVTLGSRGNMMDSYTLPIRVGSVFDGYSNSTVPVDVVLILIMPQIRIDFIGG